MNDNQKKAALACVLAFLLGCLVAFSGCSVRIEVQPPISQMETLDVKTCPCCGFAPWSDSWCEYHYGT